MAIVWWQKRVVVVPRLPICSINFYLFIHSTNVGWALLYANFRAIVLFVFDEGGKYAEVNNKWTLAFRSLEPNKKVPELSQLVVPLVSL